MPKLSVREQLKWEVVSSVLSQSITNEVAAKKLNISIRQIQRLKIKVRREGTEAIVHRLKGKPSNHRLDQTVKEQALDLVEQNYFDFKPKFAAEKLAEKHQIVVNPETLRLWMSQKKLWKIRSQKTPQYYSWRERRACFGELQQFDGSYHLWLESRLLDESGQPMELCLLAAIDDATSQITQARFDFNEGVVPVFNFWKAYVKHLGKPKAIYLDKYSTYKINHPNAVDNGDLLTQFQQATKLLDIEVICANSPQAKGRVERLFGTLQDRLVKELRLANICTVDQANWFLTEVFLPRFNEQFSVKPRKEGNVHQKLTLLEARRLNSIFSRKFIRRIKSDFTVQFKNKHYQLKEVQPTTIRPHQEILVEHWLDDTLHLTFKNQYLDFFLLPQKPSKNRSQPAILTTHKLNWIPPKTHPWRTFNI